MARNFFNDQLSKAGASDVDSSTVHVLAVDDSFVDRKVIEKLLKTLAFKVTTVDSGKRALEILGLSGDDYGSGNLNVNLIITDYCMPGMSGYDLLKAIKESSALREIPVVIMSSENVPNRINRCLEEGAEEFILKPVKLADVKRLRGHVRQQCAGNSVIEEESEETCSKRKISKDGSNVYSCEERRSYFSSRSRKF